MRYLEPGFITLNLKSYKVASFYSGMKTSRWVVEPNYVISLLLDPSENAEAYSEILPIASLRVLESIKTEQYKNVIPGVFEDIRLGRIIVRKEDLLKIFPPKEEDKLDQAEVQALRNKVREQEGIIKMLQGMLEDKSSVSVPNIESLAEVDMLKTRLKMKDENIEDLKKKVAEAEMKGSRIGLLETRVRTMTADLNEKNEIIAELKQKLSNIQDTSISTPGVSGNEMLSAPQGNIEASLRQSLREKEIIIEKLRAQVESGESDKGMISNITKDLGEKEGSSKYIGL